MPVPAPPLQRRHRIHIQFRQTLSAALLRKLMHVVDRNPRLAHAGGTPLSLENGFGQRLPDVAVAAAPFQPCRECDAAFVQTLSAMRVCDLSKQGQRKCHDRSDYQDYPMSSRLRNASSMRRFAPTVVARVSAQVPPPEPPPPIDASPPAPFGFDHGSAISSRSFGESASEPPAPAEPAGLRLVESSSPQATSSATEQTSGRTANRIIEGLRGWRRLCRGDFRHADVIDECLRCLGVPPTQQTESWTKSDGTRAARHDGW
jgi:hypothetical protein